MKYRYKLLILLLAVSIVPVVSLRTFGIHNVQMMADDLVAQVKSKQETDARQRLRLLVSNYTRSIQTSREQVEMALFYQAAAFRRLLEADVAPIDAPCPPCPGFSRPQAIEKIATGDRAPGAPDGNSQESLSIEKTPCWSADPAIAAAGNPRIVELFKSMAPIQRSAFQYLGDLVVAQYLGIESGPYSIFPCRQQDIPDTAATEQFWYRSAFAEKATAWSRPYSEPLNGREVFAVSYPITDDDETVLGVASLLVSLDRLLEKVFYIPDLPEGIAPYFFRLDRDPVGGGIGAKILALAQPGKVSTGMPGVEGAPRWLASADGEPFKAMLTDIARRRSGVREMSFGGQKSFWAYGPLLHQGSGFAFIVPGEQIVKPADRFLLSSIQLRLSKVKAYTLGFLIFLLFAATVVAVLFSRTVTKPLAQLAEAAQKLAGGNFEARVPISSTDELGVLGRMFNRVGPQLREHYRMRRSLEVAEEIQQNLLPAEPPVLEGLDVYGMTLFSDETGGDYFDFLCVDEREKDNFCVVVGDVAGHGISSALLMASVRGVLRSRAKRAGALGEMVSDVNREFAEDMADSGQFMTLFLARVHRRDESIEWVRAGHEPALLYRRSQDAFVALRQGGGAALGLAANSIYRSRSQPILPGDILFIGTDGITESRNSANELFGSRRLREIIRANAEETAKAVALTVVDAVEAFRGTSDREDDQTLVVIKVLPGSTADGKPGLE